MASVDRTVQFRQGPLQQLSNELVLQCVASSHGDSTTVTTRQDIRKSPEDWLASTEGEKKHGLFKVFLGYAPGVGKTYSMLSEGLRRKSRGEDVVIGVVADPSLILGGEPRPNARLGPRVMCVSLFVCSKGGRSSFLEGFTPALPGSLSSTQISCATSSFSASLPGEL